MTPRLGELLGEFERERRRFLAGLEGVDDATLRRQPRPEVWSMLDIVEHVVAAEAAILQGLPPLDGLVPRARSLSHRLKFQAVRLVLTWRIPVRVPSRRMLPTGDRTLADLREQWDGHARWLRAFVETQGAARAQEAFFLHPVCGPLTLEQALRLDLLHLRTHRRQLAARKASASNPPA